MCVCVQQVALESTSVKAALQRCIAQRRSAKDEATTGPESTGPGSFVHTFSAPPTVNDQSTAALLEGAGAPELWQQAMWALGRNVGADTHTHTHTHTMHRKRYMAHTWTRAGGKETELPYVCVCVCVCVCLHRCRA